MANLPPELALFTLLIVGLISTSILHRYLLLSRSLHPLNEGRGGAKSKASSTPQGFNQAYRLSLDAFKKSMNAVSGMDIPRVEESRHSRTLIAITTKGNLQHTLMALSYLTTAPKRVKNLFDIIVVDDFSDKRDEVALYIRQRGFYCVSKSEPKGLTDSWNVAFEHAVRGNYEQLILVNNDALLGPIALELMQELLTEHAIVVPITTPLGSGHAPCQDILRALKLSPVPSQGVKALGDLSRFVQNARNDMIISAFLRNKYARRTKVATYKGRVRFNGFLVGLNVSTVQRYLAYSSTRLLNEQDLPMVGQEDELARKAEEWQLLSAGAGERQRGSSIPFNIQPVVALGAFVFHFKSVTIAQGYQRLYSQRGGDMHGVVIGGRSDYRNNLTIYQVNKEEDGRLHREIRRLRQMDSIMPSIVQYPPVTRVSTEYEPAQSDECYARAREAAKSNAPFRRATCDKSIPRVRIAFAISDPHRTPRAGDIMTARELGSALERADVSIEYLHRGPQWYDPTRLVDLDILITMLDAYDSAKALAAVAPLRSEDFLYSAAGWNQSRRALASLWLLGLEIGSIAGS